MLGISKHQEWIIQSDTEISNSLESLKLCENVSKHDWNQVSSIVQETTSSSSFKVLLLVFNQFSFCNKFFKLLNVFRLNRTLFMF